MTADPASKGPSFSVSSGERTVETASGARLTIRRLGVLDKLRLFKVAGPLLAQNEPWLGLALLAYSVTSIDDVPVPTPNTEGQIEALVARLGESGIAAAAVALCDQAAPTTREAIEIAGN